MVKQQQSRSSQGVKSRAVALLAHYYEAITTLIVHTYLAKTMTL